MEQKVDVEALSPAFVVADLVGADLQARGELRLRQSGRHPNFTQSIPEGSINRPRVPGWRLEIARARVGSSSRW